MHFMEQQQSKKLNFCHTVNGDRKNKYQVPLFSDHGVVADMQLENAEMAC